MRRSMQSIMVFAVNQNGRVVHINEVENGGKCGCSCPACHAPLIAKNGGDERAHHFAHDGSLEEHSCSETALHYAAKQVIAENKKVLLPAPTILGEEGGDLVEFSEVILEHRLGAESKPGEYIVADCLGISNSDSLVIEIAVFHQVDFDKANKIQNLKIPSIEISLADISDKAWNWESLTQQVIFDVQRRKWIWQPEATVQQQSTSDGLEAALIEVGRKEWIFDVGGQWVWVKKLPYGNIKVFHRPSDYARSIVEPLCRNKGFWSAKYKGWIVFDQYANGILRCLGEAGRLMNNI